MVSRKTKQKLMKRRIGYVARVFACASFLILTIIGVSSLVRAMSLETIANENGIPSSWKTASLGLPDTITVPATFWDQRQDSCDDPDRQFEWVICGYWTAGAIQGIVKDHLGADGLPIPAYTNSTDAWNANRDVFTANVTGHDPVIASDNFYRWFHETPLSKSYNREIVFNRIGENTYTYGREGVFPLDNVNFSDGDSASEQGHNYHFTSHMRFAMKVLANGKERFEFSGDDDVWIYLNGKLVLDIGGLHEKLSGWFVINNDGTISTYVQNVNDVSDRAKLGTPSNDFNGYVDPLNQHNRSTFKDQYRTIDVGISKGDVVNLDFFYAERSTTESNTKITISNMNWPISADSDIKGEIVGKIEETGNNLVQFNTSITNRDPGNPLMLERLAAYIEDITTSGKNTEGYIPLDSSTLYYSTTPDDKDSWKPVEISAPSGNTSGFNLNTPLVMTPAGTPGDTIYFRYFAETASDAGEITSTISYYTTLNGAAGVTYDYDTVTYRPDTPREYTVTINYLYKEDDSPAAEPYVKNYPTGSKFDVDSPEIENYVPDYPNVSGEVSESNLVYTVYYEKLVPGVPPVVPETPISPTPSEPETPLPPALPVLPSLPGSDIINGELTYLAPLGEVAYVPNTGIVSNAVAAVFEVCFAEVILSQGFVMIVLLIFAASFATWFSFRKYININFATQSVTKKSHPKMTASKKTSKAKTTTRKTKK